jgi:hypothetical protein
MERMDLKTGLNAVLSSLAHPYASPIVRLDGQTAYCILAASVFMKQAGKISGAEQHLLIKRLLAAGTRTESDLRSWLAASFSASARKLWDTCRKRADELLEAGVGTFGWSAPFSDSPAGGTLLQSTGAPCPTVLFCKGSLDFDPPLLAVFNSRKPRLVSPHSSWLKALRSCFLSLDSREVALAGSMGTLTYDLVCAHALRSGLSQLLVVPGPLLNADLELSKRYGDESADRIPLLSCMLDSESCSKRLAQVCRDWILGVLAHIHLVLEIRSGGNLSAVLEEIQAKSPRPQFVFDPEETSSSNAGNRSLLTKFSEHAHAFKLPGPQDLPSVNRVQTHRPANKDSVRSSESGLRPPGFEYAFRHDDIIWGEYLYHYTRASAGPWPGETYREYLLNLFDERLLSGHSALETLIRILQEGLVRAGSKMVRCNADVISWSSHPPGELFEMRKWNRGLARWTVEPYGIAVRRDILRSLGAKPAIYGSDKSYFLLAESEKYRFQLSDSGPSVSWRHEREWRLRGDLALGKLKPDEGFVFVQTEEERAKLCSHVNPGLSIVILDGLQ